MPVLGHETARLSIGPPRRWKAGCTDCVCVPLSPGVYVVVKKGERLQKENNKGKLYLSVSGGCGFSVWDVSVVVVEHSAPLVSSGFL